MFKWLLGNKEESSGGAEATGTKELLVVSRTVAATPERAFAVFVDEFASWFPKQYTLAGDNLATIIIEPKMNGRAIERDKGRRRDRMGHGALLLPAEPSGDRLADLARPHRHRQRSRRQPRRRALRRAGGRQDRGGARPPRLPPPRPRLGEYRHKMGVKEGGWPLLMDRYAKAVAGEPL